MPDSDQIQRFEPFARTTTPIYVEKSDGRLEHHGTAAIFQHRNRAWVVTARHVLQKPPGPLWFPARPFQPLEGITYFRPATDVDIAYFELRPEMILAVRKAELRTISADSVDAFEDGELDCAVVGYPHRADANPSVRIDSEAGRIEAEQMVFESRLLSAKKLQFVPNIRPGLHVAVTAKNFFELETSESVRNIDFRGLSGGLIWQRQSDEKARAIAVVTDYDPKQKLLIGAVLAPLTQAILQSARSAN